MSNNAPENRFFSIVINTIPQIGQTQPSAGILMYDMSGGDPYHFNFRADAFDAMTESELAEHWACLEATTQEAADAMSRKLQGAVRVEHG